MKLEDIHRITQAVLIASILVLILVMCCRSNAQEVIMNIPSADVPNAGHLFMRSDSFYTQNPANYSENLNIAFGLWGTAEFSLNGVNVTRESKYIVPGFKWQVIKNSSFTLYIGDQVLAPISRNAYSNLVYEASSYTQRNIRFTIGSFHLQDAQGSHNGPMAGIEWTAKMFKNGWMIIPGIDWASGAGANGYASPGIMFQKKSFFISPGYMIANPHNPNGSHQTFVMIGATL